MNTLQWLETLVSFNTISHHSNLELINFIENYLKKFGISYHLTFNKEKTKANLFAIIPNAKGETQAGLILSGHTDVVPVAGQDWKTDPFKATKIKDKIYGRGTCDMKGFVATVMSLIPAFVKASLQTPLYLAFTYDEEVGCKGVPPLIEGFLRQGIKPKFCIVGEPSNMQPVCAHKGVALYRCGIEGKPVHSSLAPKGTNAIDYLAHWIVFIQQLANKLAKKGPFDKDFDIAHSTLSTNFITGGNAYNIVPQFSEFILEHRNLPNVNLKIIENEIKQFLKTTLKPLIKKNKAQAKVSFKTLGSNPSFSSSPKAKLYKLAQKVSGSHKVRKVAYATEAGYFAAEDIETIVWGPGDINQAHKPNEFITMSQLEKCEKYLLKLAQEI